MIVTRIRPLRRMWPADWDDFDHLRRDMTRALDNMARGFLPNGGLRMFPLVNVTQDGENFYVRAELPGVKAEDLDVSAMDRKLTIAGKRELPVEKEGVSYHRREREGGSFSRSVQLPADFDRDRVEAAYENGILTITLPLAEETKPRQITVKAS